MHNTVLHLKSKLPVQRVACFLLTLFVCGIILPVHALQNATPWSAERSFQNLVYGSSSFNDVRMAMGKPPDEVVNSEQMFPPIVNFNYYDENKSGAATVFVFENGLLVGLQYKSADNQYIDLTYFLQNNGDRALNLPYTAGYFPYYPYFPMYGVR
jgi:hypothetical protein